MADYGFDEHVDRFACWAAGRAAGRGQQGLTGEVAHLLVSDANLRQDLIGKKAWALGSHDFDALHRKLRNRVIDRAFQLSVGRDGAISHGVAAKLINVYLKVSLIAQGREVWKERIHVHPPVDRVLLQNLKHNAGPEASRLRSMKNDKWTSFDSKEYEEVIEALREIATRRGHSLWQIEESWDGYQ